MVCTFESGLTIGPVEISVAANINDQSIELLETKEKKQDGKNDTLSTSCPNALTQITLNYSLSGDSLTLKSPDGSQPSMILKRL